MELTREIRDKRIAVMRDVIETLDSNSSYRMASGCYIHGTLEAEAYAYPLDELIDRVSSECECCFLAAAFLSMAKIEANEDDRSALGITRTLAGTMTVVTGCRNEIFGRLAQIFDGRQLAMMECAFERSDRFGSNDTSQEEESRSEEFCFSIPDWNDEDGDLVLARAIAQNVIDHDGEFVP